VHSERCESSFDTAARFGDPFRANLLAGRAKRRRDGISAVVPLAQRSIQRRAFNPAPSVQSSAERSIQRRAFNPAPSVQSSAIRTALARPG
jgi:hypothetical protein